MTIGAWIGLTLIIAVIWGTGIPILACSFAKRGVWIITCAIMLVVSIAISGLFIWYRNNSESGRRALKDQQSNLEGGIERLVSVYDINGNLIKEYSGKFDIETDRESYILFDDENGDRHMIYYTTGTIIVDEK